MQQFSQNTQTTDCTYILRCCPLSILLEEHIGIAFENYFVLDGVEMLYTAAHD